MRRNFLIAAAVALCTAQFGMHAFASSSVVSVQFPVFSTWVTVDGPHNYGNPHNYTAGAYIDPSVSAPVTNWNWDPILNNNSRNAAGVSTMTNLIDSHGVATAYGYSVSYGQSDQPKDPFPAAPGYWIPTGNGDANLDGGVVYNRSSGIMALALSGLNAADSYDVYAYVTSPWWNTGSATVTVGGITTSITSTHSLGTWQLPAATSTIGNYVEFTGVPGSLLNSDGLALNSLSGTIGLSGFQLVDNGPAVPEPASLGLLGASALLLLRRRK